MQSSFTKRNLIKEQFHWHKKKIEPELCFLVDVKQRIFFFLTLGLWYSFIWIIRLFPGLIAVLFTNRSPTDEDIITFIHNTPSLIIYVAKGTDTKYVFDIPHCELKLFGGNYVRSFQMKYNDTKIISFQWNGHNVSNRKIIMSIFFMYLNTSAHTKIHVLGCVLMKIFKKFPEDKILAKILPEAGVITNGLHQALLTSSTSPLVENYPWLFLRVAPKNFAILEAKNWQSFSHSGYVVLKHLPIVQYLLSIWKILAEELKLIGVEKNNPFFVDLIFAHSVLHTLDHHQAFKFSRGIFVTNFLNYYNFDAAEEKNRYKFDFLDSLNGEVFKRQFVSPTYPPSLWATNFMRNAKSEFWQRVYIRICQLENSAMFDHASEIRCGQFSRILAASITY